MARADAAERSHQDLHHRHLTMTSSGKSCQERLEAVESHLREAAQEESRLREQAKQLEVLKYKHEQEIGELKIQVSGLLGQIGAKEKLADSQAAQLEQAFAQRRSLEDSLAFTKLQSQAFEEKFALSAQEIVKGNEIIRTMHASSKQVKAKLKLKVSEAARRERAVNDLERGEEFSKHVMEEKENEIARSKEREVTRQRELEESKRKLAEAHEVLRTNQEVIEYLNRQLTERDLRGVAPITGFAGASRFSPDRGVSSLGSTFERGNLALTATSGLGSGGLGSGGLGSGGLGGGGCIGLGGGGGYGGGSFGARGSEARTLTSTATQLLVDRYSSPPSGHSTERGDDFARNAASSLSTMASGLGHLSGPVSYRSPGKETHAAYPLARGAFVA